MTPAVTPRPVQSDVWFMAVDEKVPPELVRGAAGALAGNRRITLQILDQKTGLWRIVSEVRPGERYRLSIAETTEVGRAGLKQEPRQ